MHETLLMHVLICVVRQCYGKRIRYLDLGCTDGQPKRMDRVPNAQIRELRGVKKGLDERIDEGVLRWFAHLEGMERRMIAKRVYVREFAGSRSTGRSRKT